MNNVKQLIIKPLAFAILFTCTLISTAQDTEQKSGLDEGPLDSQFDYIIKKSSSYEAYQVVKRTWLYKVKTNTLDSIKGLKENILNLETKNEAQLNEINSLKSDLKETNENLNQVTSEKDSFSFMGILMSKKTYNVMVWTLVFTLALAVVISFLLFKRSHSVTQKTKESLNDKQEELESHRKWALEREQTLARELNKLKQKYKGLD
jgi:peptidoglycan hydrolase CwlO-like protein